MSGLKRCFLLDLDGTVADNGEGILKSAQYALDSFGIHQEPEEKLRRFVGPPLDQSFRELYGFSQEQAIQAVAKYRERYAVKGVYENRLYPGVRELQAAGADWVVPTVAELERLCLELSDF